MTNRINGKKYVGQTVQTLENRWQQHVRDRFKYDYPLYNAIRKYGAVNFSVEELGRCTEPLLDALEQHFIRALKTFARDGGYNLTTGGQYGRHRLAKSACAKISRAQIAHYANFEARRAHSELSRLAHNTPAAKRNHSAASRAAHALRASQGAIKHSATWLMRRAEDSRRSRYAKRDKLNELCGA